MKTLAHARSAVAWVAPTLFIFGVLGCGGDDLPREGVSGSVMLGGEPLKTGIITFVPTDPSTPTQGGTTIVAGSYEIPRAQGLVPGKYKVVISSSEADDAAKEKPVEDFEELGPGMPPIPAEEAIPPQFGADTQLEANVTAGGANQFDFTLVVPGGG